MQSFNSSYSFVINLHLPTSAYAKENYSPFKASLDARISEVNVIKT